MWDLNFLDTQNRICTYAVKAKAKLGNKEDYLEVGGGWGRRLNVCIILAWKWHFKIINTSPFPVGEEFWCGSAGCLFLNTSLVGTVKLSGKTLDTSVLDFPVHLNTSYPDSDPYRLLEQGLSCSPFLMGISMCSIQQDIGLFYRESEMETRGWMENHGGSQFFYNSILEIMSHNFSIILFLSEGTTSPPTRERGWKILVVRRGVHCECVKGCQLHVFIVIWISFELPRCLNSHLTFIIC